MDETQTQPSAVAIDGATEFYAIIGDPIVQAKTPALINPLIARAGRNAILAPLHVPQHAFGTVVPALMQIPTLKGLVVTYPFKERALDLVEHATLRARAVGGINAMRRNADGSWSGDIFDGLGLLLGISDTCRIEGAKVLLIGAGGAGRAIGVALAEAGAAAIAIHDVDSSRSNALAATIAKSFPSCRADLRGPEAAGYDIVINATPVGMKPGDGLPANLGALAAGMTVVDIVPTIEPTPLLQLAASAGAKTISGKAMTAGQARALLEFFGLIEADE